MDSEWILVLAWLSLGFLVNFGMNLVAWFEGSPYKVKDVPTTLTMTLCGGLTLLAIIACLIGFALAQSGTWLKKKLSITKDTILIKGRNQ